MMRVKQGTGWKKGRGRPRFGTKVVNGVVINDLEAIKVIEVMRKLRSEGNSYDMIAYKLVALRIPSPGTTAWNGPSVRNILIREVR